MKALTRDEFLQKRERRREWCPIPELGEEAGVYVQALSALERSEFEAASLEKAGPNREVNLVTIRQRLVAMSCVDDDGGKLFTEEDVAALGEVDGAVVDRPFEIAMRLSRLRNQDLAELGKGSGATLNGSSAVGSPSH